MLCLSSWPTRLTWTLVNHGWPILLLHYTIILWILEGVNLNCIDAALMCVMIWNCTFLSPNTRPWTFILLWWLCLDCIWRLYLTTASDICMYFVCLRRKSFDWSEFKQHWWPSSSKNFKGKVGVEIMSFCIVWWRKSILVNPNAPWSNLMIKHYC